MSFHYKREAFFALVSFAITLGLYGMLGNTLAHRIYDSYFFPHKRLFVEGLVYAAALSVIAYSAVLYHSCLIGYYLRMIKHRPASFEQVEELYDRHAPSMTVIIPAYKEERMVMWQTMMSAALSEYQAKRVVLLIDDPHQPKNLADMRALETARSLPHELQEQFAEQAALYREARDAFSARQQLGTADARAEMWKIADHYDAIADWLEQEVNAFSGYLPTDELSFDLKFFAETILLKPATLHRERAMELRKQAPKTPLSLELISRHYNRLASLFNVNFTSFERKKYANLSHDANKAMNLNSYIALIDKSWKEVETPNGLHLVECEFNDATFTIPAADYVNTIDADSLMTHDYIARLIHHLEQPENDRIAIAQSPCSSIPGSPVALERIAGAGIDTQYHLHQGYTFYDASYWVGANAMIRHLALEDIREIHEVDGKTVSIYIQDRTVIEDTESTIDLVDKGWKLYNYPARMTFSASPADFGSLLIQRRRWANGGLIILPKLLRYAFRSKKDLRLAKELFMRFNYLAMTSISVFTTVLMMSYHFSPRLSSHYLLYANIPLLLLLARDFKNCGYKYTDIFRICAMNLMLFPVIAAGVLKQFQQIVTGRKIPFGRTPKVKDRTAAPAMYYLLELAILGYLGHHVWQGYQAKSWGDVASYGVTASMFLYAILRYIGPIAMVQDFGAGIFGSRTKAAATQAAAQQIA